MCYIPFWRSLSIEYGYDHFKPKKKNLFWISEQVDLMRLTGSKHQKVLNRDLNYLNGHIKWKGFSSATIWRIQKSKSRIRLASRLLQTNSHFPMLTNGKTKNVLNFFWEGPGSVWKWHQVALVGIHVIHKFGHDWPTKKQKIRQNLKIHVIQWENFPIE